MKVVHINLTGTAVIEEPPTACVDYFDGLYLGHQKLIEEVRRAAAGRNTRYASAIFDPDPWCAIRGLQDIAHTTSMKQRMWIAEAVGTKHQVILDFPREMADLIPQDLREKVFKPSCPDTLVCGYDLHHGRKGKGDAQSLHEQTDFDVYVIDQVSSEYRKISSSRIGELIQEGDIEKATRFMGRWYDMEGSVKGGSHVGRRNGFPTTNLRLQEPYVMPKKGVYVRAVKVLGTWHRVMMDVGNNPTHNYQGSGSIEVHLLGFDQDIYEGPVIFRFLFYMREERKSSDAHALGEQLKKDLVTACSYFERGKESALCD